MDNYACPTSVAQKMGFGSGLNVPNMSAGDPPKPSEPIKEHRSIKTAHSSGFKVH